MKTIQSKFTALSLVCTLLCTVVVGGFGLWAIYQAQEESSKEILALTCEQQAETLDLKLQSIQSSVDSCAEIIGDQIPSVSLLSDEQWCANYLSYCESLVSSVAKNTDGVCTFYLRFAPELSDPFAGFFYTRQGRDETLQEQTLTDILAFDPSDTEHVGWYYEPKAAGVPMWMEPYFNQNIGVYMVSYVVPLYVEDTFVGVVGMDVDFNVVNSMVRAITPYETGHAFLVNKQGTIMFHPDETKTGAITDHVPSLVELVEKLPALKIGESGDIRTYESDGNVRKLACSKLQNGMVLMLSADVSEINRPVNSLLRTVALVGLGMALLTAFIVIRVSGRISKPLVQLTEVADQIAEGNFDVAIPDAGDDEVGRLSRSLSVTVGSLKKFIAGMNDKAYKDALTRVKNKAAYDEAAIRLQAELDGGFTEFALLMIDLNDLKHMNDQYGHECGDRYLCASCHAICDVFEHSPVYRVGGDEFVVILRGVDFANREGLLAELDETMRRTQSEDEPWNRISVAKGIGVCEPGDARLKDIFKRADEAMYDDKRRMKVER